MPHIHKDIDFTVEVFIVFNNTVLLRKHDKYGIWLSIGGHIELDEDPIEAAQREVKEEVGIDVTIIGEAGDFKNDEGYKELIPPVFLNRHRIDSEHEHITMTYVASSKSNKITQGEGEVSEELHWFSKEELDDPAYGISEHIKRYAKEALLRVGAVLLCI